MQHGYCTLGPIAAGAFSQVNRARHHSSQEEVAVKTYVTAKCQRAPHLASQMKLELGVLKMLQPTRHVNIANLLELCETPQMTHAILQYCSGGSLHRRLQSNMLHRVGLGDLEAAAISSQICAALAHLHTRGIAHRDLKPENVLYADSSQTIVKVCDFGFAKHCGEKRVRTVCGSPQYMAPEVNGRASYFARPVDMWALGGMVYEMLHARPAFRGATLEQLGLRAMRASHEPFKPDLSPASKALIKGLFMLDPEKRLTSAVTSKHSWIAAGTAAVAAACPGVVTSLTEVATPAVEAAAPAADGTEAAEETTSATA